MPAAVLDAHALLAFFWGEEAAGAVKELLHKAASADRPLHMTEVNYAEVKYVLLKKDGAEKWEQAADILKSLPIEFYSATRPLADSAADFKARFKISVADAYRAWQTGTPGVVPSLNLNFVPAIMLTGCVVFCFAA